MSDHDRLLDLLDGLYAASAEPLLWPRFMEQLSDALGGPVAFHILDASGAAFRHAVRWDPDLLAGYASHWSKVNPWLPAQRARPPDVGSVILSSAMFPDSRLTRTEFYDGFLAPQGLFYGVGLVFQKQPQRSIRITSARAMSRGGFESAEQVLLRRLGPHLNRAFTIQEKLGCFVERSQAFAEVVARLPISVLLLDDRGEVLFANRRAEELLRRRDGLALDAAARTLVAIGREDTSRLRRLIHQAAQTSSASGEEAAGSVLLRREASGRPLHTLVLPLKAHHYYVGRRPAAVGVLVSELDQRLELSAEHARSLYDLTPAESRLASWLLSGRRLKDVADELHVSLHTVRAQLKSVFSKTGTNRQGELIRLLALGPGLIADRDHDSRKA